MMQRQLIVLCLVAVSFAAACVSDEDCSLLGVCQDGTCACAPGWMGPLCGQLHLAPAEVENGYNVANTSSWGGAPIFDQGSGMYHLFVAEFINNCGLQTWHSNSRVVHAVSRTAIGPYKFVDEVIPIYSHNPTVASVADGGGLILMHIGSGTPDSPPLRCRNGSTQTNYSLPHHTSHTDRVDMASSVGTICAEAVAGPWFSCNWTGAASPGGFTNPTVWALANGSIAVGGNSNYSLAFTMGSNCSRYACGAWSNLSHKTPGRTGEDPWMWQDRDGHWHALFHDMAPDLPAGRHAFSRDGEAWTLSAELVYNGTVLFADGSEVTFTKRERPHLLLEPGTRRPLALATGVMAQQEHIDDHAWTLVQAVLV